MGADLYFSGSYSLAHGHFRDAYNNGSLLRAYGLSWWRDVAPLCGADGAFTATRKFLALLDGHLFIFRRCVRGVRAGDSELDPAFADRWVKDSRRLRGLLHRLAKSKRVAIFSL